MSLRQGQTKKQRESGGRMSRTWLSVVEVEGTLVMCCCRCVGGSPRPLSEPVTGSGARLDLTAGRITCRPPTSKPAECGQARRAQPVGSVQPRVPTGLNLQESRDCLSSGVRRSRISFDPAFQIPLYARSSRSSAASCAHLLVIPPHSVPRSPPRLIA